MFSSTVDIYNLLRLCNQQYNKHKQAQNYSGLWSIIHPPGPPGASGRRGAAVDVQCALCTEAGRGHQLGQSLLPSRWTSPWLVLLGEER